MRIFVFALMIGLVAACEQPEAEVIPANVNEDAFQIPTRFWGEYNEVLSDCGTGLNDSRLIINSNRVRFYESNQFLNEIYHLQDGSVILITEASGEGQRWVNSFKLSLSDDSQALIMSFPRSAEVNSFDATRFRCPNP